VTCDAYSVALRDEKSSRRRKNDSPNECDQFMVMVVVMVMAIHGVNRCENGVNSFGLSLAF
jgi:hypothetical protein